MGPGGSWILEEVPKPSEVSYSILFIVNKTINMWWAKVKLAVSQSKCDKIWIIIAIKIKVVVTHVECVYKFWLENMG